MFPINSNVKKRKCKDWLGVFCRLFSYRLRVDVAIGGITVALAERFWHLNADPDALSDPKLSSKMSRLTVQWTIVWLKMIALPHDF